MPLNKENELYVFKCFYIIIIIIITTTTIIIIIIMTIIFGQTTGPSNSQQKKRTSQIADFSVSVDHKMKIRESEKRGKYLELARKQNKKKY